LRWAGGKQNFLARFGDCLPRFEGHYFEPFLGGGSTFFYLQRRHRGPLEATLGDKNAQLIMTFGAVRSDPERTFSELQDLRALLDAAEEPRDVYYRVRDDYNAELPRPAAAKFIFLNRLCWNGLYRVNQKGQFNVPYGRPKPSNSFPTLDELRAASAALTRVRLRATSWETTIAAARPGDFIFLDPPYYSDVTVEDTKYGRKRFGLDEHERLAARLVSLSRRDVGFVLTNSGEPEMVALYEDAGLSVTRVLSPRTISSKVNDRTPVAEVIVSPPVGQRFHLPLPEQLALQEDLTEEGDLATEELSADGVA
jgi:DNA adenine methylase